MLKKLNKNDLQVNIPVDWPIYSVSGRLLLHPGQSFHSEQIIEVLLWRGLFHGNESTFASGEYEEHVTIENEELAEYETEKENYNNDFLALTDKKANQNDLFTKGEESVFDSVSENKYGNGSNLNENFNSDISYLNKNSVSTTENEQQHWINEIKTDVLKIVRSELDGFFKNSFREQLQHAIKNEVQKNIQENVVSHLSKKIDGKIKKEVNRFIESEYGRNNDNPIKRLIVISSQLELTYIGLDEHSPDSASGILSLATEIQELCTEYPDAMLMSIHLHNNGSYTVRHPLDMAILCELIAIQRGINDKLHRRYIIAAALTCDFSMRELQKKLQTQSTGLDDSQRETINFHTVQSIAILLRIGVTEPVWLDTVAQHHERIDGSGYPLHYKEDKICEGAKILAVCDRYSAMVTARTYRTALNGKDALSVFFSEEEQLYDKDIIVALISELNIYPPGTFVQLVNGEYAVVTHRGDSKTGKSKIEPNVVSFANADGTNIDPLIVRECRIDKFSIKEAVFLDKPFSLAAEKIWQLSTETK